MFALAAGHANAQYGSDFEAVNASPDGVILTGQDGYYIPGGTDSTDYLAYTYDGNVLGFADHPTGGGLQFVAGVGPGSPTFARAQRDITWGTGIWSVTYDTAAEYLPIVAVATEVGQVNRGIVRSGGIEDVAESDDVDFCWQPDAIAATIVAPINFEVRGNTTVGNPVRMEFNIEVAATHDGVVMRVELFNFTNGSYATANNFPNIPTTDTVFTINVANPADFVNDGDGAVQARISFLRPAGAPPFWNACIDRIWWSPRPAGANNVGSFSVQPYPGSASYIHLFSWVNPTQAQLWRAFYLAYNAAGTADAQPGRSPGPQWDNLELNHWYRFNTVIDFDLNRIVEVSITDLDTGTETTVDVSGMGYYLEGGEAGGSPMPTGFRFFAGGGVPNNAVAWDNIDIAPAVD